MDVHVASLQLAAACKKKVQGLIDILKPTDKHYSDPDFLPGDSAIGPEPLDQYDFEVPSGWERLSKIIANPCLFQGKAPVGDVVVGALGTACLLDALQALRGSVPSLFVHHDVDVGIYAVRLFHDGAWTCVVVDDYVPVRKMRNGAPMPLFATSSIPSEVWPMVIEKAYAKLNNHYAHIDGGLGRTAIPTLSGACTLRHTLGKSPQNSFASFAPWGGFSLSGAGKYTDIVLWLSLFHGKIRGGGEDPILGTYSVTGQYNEERVTFERTLLRTSLISVFTGKFQTLKDGKKNWGLTGKVSTDGREQTFELVPLSESAFLAAAYPAESVRHYLAENLLVCLSVRGRAHDDAPNVYTGLFEGRSYPVAATRELPADGDLFCIANVSKEETWKGAWSQGSLKMTSAVRELLDFNDGDSSRFYMNAEDVCEFGESFDVYRVLPASWTWKSFQGMMRSDTSNVPWYREEQYVLELFQESTVCLTLHQPSSKPYEGVEMYPIRIGIRVVQLFGRGERVEGDDVAVVVDTDAVPESSVSLTASLIPNGKPFFVVPYTSSPSRKMPYRLSVASSAPVDVRVDPVEQYHCACCGRSAEFGYRCVSCEGVETMCETCWHAHGRTKQHDPSTHCERRLAPVHATCTMGKQCVDPEASNMSTWAAYMCLSCGDDAPVVMCAACVDSGAKPGEHKAAHACPGSMIRLNVGVVCASCSFPSFAGGSNVCKDCLQSVCDRCHAAGWAGVPGHDERHSVEERPDKFFSQQFVTSCQSAAPEPGTSASTVTYEEATPLGKDWALSKRHAVIKEATECEPIVQTRGRGRRESDSTGLLVPAQEKPIKPAAEVVNSGVGCGRQSSVCVLL